MSKLRRIVVFILVFVLLFSMATVCTASSGNRYAKNGTFEATGSPLLNKNFTTDLWNKWEIVAWGVFLSNFVVPMLDSYETAFNTASTAGSKGSGFKALDFSIAADPGSTGILQNFTRFAIDSALNEQKDLFVSYYYLDQAGNIIVPKSAENQEAKVIDDALNPTRHDIQPASVGPADFTSLLPANLADAPNKADLLNNDAGAWIAGTSFASNSFDDVFGVNGMIYRPWKMLGDTDAVIDVWNYPDLIAIPPSVKSDLNRPVNNIYNASSELPAAYASRDAALVKDIAVAKLPILWLQAGDGTYVKVWDMLDPWDYQVLIAMLAKEVNSDSTGDTAVGLTTGVWKSVMNNIDAAFEGKTALHMDCFGNITTTIEGRPVVVIPAAYNKHLTTKPMVNLVNSLFLTGPTSKVDSSFFMDKGKMPVKSALWALSNNNETEKDGASAFGPGMPAFGWKGSAMPNNAVALYYDSDTLAYMTYKDRVQADTTLAYYQNGIEYGGYKLFPQAATILGVLDLDIGINGNRKFSRAGKSDLVTPRLTLTGISKVAGLGASDAKDYKDRKLGTKSLMTALTFQEGIIGLLPSSYREAETEYAQSMIWQNVQTDILGKAVVVPVAMQSGTDSNNKTWSGLARDFVNYYGTQYYPQRKNSELQRLSIALCGESGNKVQTGDDVFESLTKSLMYDSDNIPSMPLILHSKTPEMATYMKPMLLSEGISLKIPNWPTWLRESGFVWKDPTFVNINAVDVNGWGSLKSSVFKTAFPSMTQRWVKAYTTHPSLTQVAVYLGMRGDSEFAAAAAPFVYLSYLNNYGVNSVDGNSGVYASTLNSNPTKFNEKIFDAKSSSVLNFDPTEGATVAIGSKKDLENAVDMNIYKLLSLTDGHDYKRQILSSFIGNFIYEQYNNIVYGGTLEYRSGGIQNIVTRSQTGFLRFPSLEDNVFTRWFYEDYATVALILLAIGLVFIIVFGIFRGRKVTWFVISAVLLVSSVLLIPFVNDIASTAMDGLVAGILKDKSTLWSMTEMVANSRMEEDFLSTGLSEDEAEIAKDITKSLSLAYTDRSLVLKQDISHKVVSLGNFEAYQKFASTRWMLPTILRQFTAEDGSAAYLYVPLIDVADDAANAYWWYNPEDAINSGGIAASDTTARYAIGTEKGTKRAEYTAATIKDFYPDYHWTDASKVAVDKTMNGKLSYRSISQTVVGSITSAVSTHDYIYMYMNNAYDDVGGSITPDKATQQKAVLNLCARSQVVPSQHDTNKTFWGDPDRITDTVESGGMGTFISKLAEWKSLNPAFNTAYPAVGHGAILKDVSADGAEPAKVNLTTLRYDQANTELLQTAQKYVRDERDTMFGEFAYLWSTETPYPYFYALVKDTMAVMGQYDYETGTINTTLKENAWNTKSGRLGVILNALTGVPKKVGGTDVLADPTVFFGDIRRTFMTQSGLLGAEDVMETFPNALLPSNLVEDEVIFTGYGRDVLDLESMFHNMIPYMYEMTLMTGGLVGEDENDKGLFGAEPIADSEYRTYAGLPKSWLYRCNWATKIVEAPEYNKSERIGYYANGEKHEAYINMTYLPDAYKAVEFGGRDMIFSEAQFKMSGLNENDLTTLELKLIKLNKKVSDKWTLMINYINAKGITAEVMCRQMALDALMMFNDEITPKGLGNTAYALIPSTIDLRSLSFDTLMRVILLNTSKDTNFFGTDAMESTITEFGLFTGVCLLVTAFVCVYCVTLLRAFFLAFLFLMGVYGVARGVFASTASKRATLFGYLTNIVILFGLSFLYYEVFNILMTGADSASYISSGLQGVSAAPTIAILIVLVASVVYLVFMWKMFRIALGSVVSGTHDLGYGIYKDKAQAGLNRFAKGISDIRAGHSFEDMTSKISETRASWGASVAGASYIPDTAAGGSRSGKSKRKRDAIRSSGAGTGSGARALQDGAGKNTRTISAMDDYAAIDATISRGGGSSSSQTTNNPALEFTLDDYFGTTQDTRR